MRRDKPEPPRRPVLAPADRQAGQVHLASYGQGGDRFGEGVVADELQDQRTQRYIADPAQPRPERMRQVVGPVGEVGRSLTGHQPDPDQIHGPDAVFPGQDREHRLAAEVRCQPGKRHRGLPPAPVEPPPEPVPHRYRDEPGEPVGVHDPQTDQAYGDSHRQTRDTGPAQAEPGDDDQRGHRGQGRMRKRKPEHSRAPPTPSRYSPTRPPSAKT
jgi:hypothetical protein